MSRKSNKRFLALIVAIALSFSLCACGEKTPNQTKEENSSLTEEILNTATVEETKTEDATPLQEELLDKTLAWAAWSDDGPLKRQNDCKVVPIKTAKDLDPYRQYLTTLTAEEEKTILEDTYGYCVLLEITSLTPYSVYSTSSVYRSQNTIEILISEFDEAEEEGLQPQHTFFLLYLPDEIYNGETIRVVFI